MKIGVVSFQKSHLQTFLTSLLLIISRSADLNFTSDPFSFAI